MSFAFTPGDDFESTVDGLQPITLHRPDGQVVAVTHALRRVATTSEPDASSGQIAQDDAFWHLPAAEVGAAPELGAMLIEDDGTAWTVLQAQQQALRTRWRCLTRRLTIRETLDTLVTIEVATPGKDAHGAATTSWTAAWPNLRARIQPVATVPQQLHGASQAVATHLVYLAEDVPVGANHRVLAADGRLFRIERAQRAEQLGKLMRIEVTQLNTLA